MRPDSVPSVILVVDDDPRIRQAIAWTLEDEGYVVVCAADGISAVQQAAMRPPSLVILDMVLPRLNGDGVAAAIRQAHGADLPILTITADGRARAKARRIGAYAYLRKPFEMEHLLASVRRGLGSD